MSLCLDCREPFIPEHDRQPCYLRKPAAKATCFYRLLPFPAVGMERQPHDDLADFFFFNQALEIAGVALGIVPKVAEFARIRGVRSSPQAPNSGEFGYLGNECMWSEERQSCGPHH